MGLEKYTMYQIRESFLLHEDGPYTHGVYFQVRGKTYAFDASYTFLMG